MKRGPGARAALALGLVPELVLGCSEPSRGEERLPLPAQALPAMHCTPLPAQTGDCARDADCGEGQRCGLDEGAAQDQAPAPLRCGAPIGTGENRARCGAGGECESGLCALAGVCVVPCSESADCPLGQICQPLEVRLGEDALTQVGACARQAAFPPDVSLQAQPAQLRAGQLTTLHAPIAGDDALLFLRTDCARRPQLQRIVQAEDGRVWFDLARQLNGVVQLNPSSNEGALLPVLLPNNPRLSLAPDGGYDLTLAIDADSDGVLLSAVRRARGTRLDLNVFYVGGGDDLEAGGLHPGDARFGEVLAQLAARYEHIGLALGSVREYDVVGGLRARLSALPLQPEQGGPPQARDASLGELFALSAGVDDGGINLFVVRDMGPLLGISGGIPGAIGLHGTEASGVAIALDAIGLERADSVIFHEICHQMGLFHTTELDGFVMEPLSDTPSCPVDRDSDGDGILRTDECAAHGGDNLMFWEGLGDLLRRQQVAVLRRSPLLR